MSTFCVLEVLVAPVRILLPHLPRLAALSGANFDSGSNVRLLTKLLALSGFRVLLRGASLGQLLDHPHR